MSRPKRSDQELRAASAHLGYEIEMFFAAAGEIREWERTQEHGHRPTRSALNCYLESWAVHLRTLHEFFFGSEGRARKGDMLASDYFGPGEWARIRPSAGRTSDMTRVAKEIVHLTYARLNVPPDERGWEVDTITGWMEKEVVRPFLANVPHPLVPRGFRVKGAIALALKPQLVDEDY
jgi:hypothetical protein